MKAALLVEPGRIDLDDVPSPTPGPDEVRIAVVGVGLCGSDLSVFRGTGMPRRIRGSWATRRSARSKRSVRAVPTTRLGETVVIEPNIVCGSLRTMSSRTDVSMHAAPVGRHEPTRVARRAGRRADAARVAGHDRISRGPRLRRADDGRRDGAPTAPGPGARVGAVVGVGAQGSLMCLALQRRGAEVVVADVNPERTAFAVGLGAVALEDVPTRSGASTSSWTPPARHRPSSWPSLERKSAARSSSSAWMAGRSSSRRSRSSAASSPSRDR